METKTNQTETGVATTNNSNAAPTIISTNSSKLAEILMDNIEKVKSDAKYIPQAEAVNTQIKSMIELGKAEIELMKVAAFMSR